MPVSDTTSAPLRGRLRNLEAERFARRQRLFDELHALDLLELALRLRGLGGDGTKAVGEFLQRGDFLLLVFVGGVLLLVTLFLLPEKVGVVAGILDQFAFVDFEDGLDDFIHELAIV